MSVPAISDPSIRDPMPTPGMKISQTPEEPSERMAWNRPSHWLKSPTTLTRWAVGAQTAKLAPGTPLIVRKWEPNLS